MRWKALEQGIFNKPLSAEPDNTHSKGKALFTLETKANFQQHINHRLLQQGGAL